MIDDPSDAIPVKTGSPDPAEYANASEDPADRIIGDGPMTKVQAAYLQALCAEVCVDFDPALSRAAASERIDQLKAETRREA